MDICISIAYASIENVGSCVTISFAYGQIYDKPLLDKRLKIRAGVSLQLHYQLAN